MAQKKMTRTTKGIVAALLGVGLIGGYGTFALWSQSQSVTGNQITAGDFEISAKSAPTWSDVSPETETGWTGTDPFVGGGAATAIDIGTFLMVPGDLLEYSAPIHVVATGDNMKAQLSVDTSQVTVPTTIEDHIVYGVKVLDSAENVKGTGDGTNTIVVPLDKTTATGADYQVVIRVGFDGATPNTAGVTDTIDLSGMTFDMKQVRP